MEKHKQIYLDYYNYDPGDTILCEVCKSIAVDIHHIFARQMGGSKYRDFPFNLIALCRTCHIKYGDREQWYEFLLSKKKLDVTYIDLDNNSEFFNIDGWNVPRKFVYYLNKLL